uniref:Uncharacterized protein n=1 Tax=Pararge aegeria TaxID=116150 RepID=S4PIP7_9NEOP
MTSALSYLRIDCCVKKIHTSLCKCYSPFNITCTLLRVSFQHCDIFNQHCSALRIYEQFSKIFLVKTFEYFTMYIAMHLLVALG